MTCPLDHEALKHSEGWTSLPLVGLQPTYDEPDQPQHLELRNCTTCHSTLCKPIHAQRAA